MSKSDIISGNTNLGIELGSTRIKAVLINSNFQVIAQGNHTWENQYIDGYWTYSEKSIWNGLRSCIEDLQKNIFKTYDIYLEKLQSIGLSGMMHGYLALDINNQMLTPFRTWRNTSTELASQDLSRLFSFHVPQRWTIAHLYQAVYNRESHVRDIHYLTTLSGYLHYMLTGMKVVGIGEASGIFPIDGYTHNYDGHMIDLMNHWLKDKVNFNVLDILPNVKLVGENAGLLTQVGARLLDPTGHIRHNTPMCPPEGDAQTGMVSTNSINEKTGNISVGTSAFAMIVLDKPLTKPIEGIDIVTTPEGKTVAMVHTNNCTSELNAWVSLFKDTLNEFNHEISEDELYKRLFESALIPEADADGILSYPFISGEHVIELEKGIPMLIRKPSAQLNVKNIMKAELFSSIATLRLGMDLLKNENVIIDKIMGHGGLFKTPVVGQKILASALNLPIIVNDNAGEGGAFGMAILASYMISKMNNKNLTTYLEHKVFLNNKYNIERPDQKLQKDFNHYLEKFKECIDVQKSAIECVR